MAPDISLIAPRKAPLLSRWWGWPPRSEVKRCKAADLGGAACCSDPEAPERLIFTIALAELPHF